MTSTIDKGFLIFLLLMALLFLLFIFSLWNSGEDDCARYQALGYDTELKGVFDECYVIINGVSDLYGRWNIVVTSPNESRVGGFS